MSSAGQDSMIRHWDLDAMICTRQVKGCDFGMLSLSLSPNRKALLSSGADGKLRTWAIDTFDETQEFTMPSNVLPHAALFTEVSSQTLISRVFCFVTTLKSSSSSNSDINEL